MQCVLLHGSYSSKESVKYGVPQGSVLGPILFSLFISDLPLHVKNISADCDMLADDKTLHTSGKDILQIRSNMQDSLDQVSKWCDGHQPDQDQVKKLEKLPAGTKPRTSHWRIAWRREAWKEEALDDLL